MKIIRRGVTFNVKGTWYTRTVFQRIRSASMYVIHRGRRFTVNYSQYGDTFTWAPWADANNKTLANFHY